MINFLMIQGFKGYQVSEATWLEYFGVFFSQVFKDKDYKLLAPSHVNTVTMFKTSQTVLEQQGIIMWPNVIQFRLV